MANNKLNKIIKKHKAPLALLNIQNLLIENKDLTNKRFIQINGSNKNNSGIYSAERFYKNITKF
jgi:hypothetical protein